MCTVTSRIPKLQVAKEDIITYKIVYVKYKSILGIFTKRYIVSSIFYKKYSFNKVYKTKLEKFKYCISRQVFLSGNAFYSYKYYPSKIYLAPDEYVVKCIIPKGSSYCLCTDYDGIKIYHSDKIKITEIIYGK